MPHFTKLFKAAISRVYGAEGVPVTVAQSAAVARNRNLVKDAVAKGATIIYGGHSDHSHLSYKIPLTVVQGVAAGMDLYQTESFGPTVSLIEYGSDQQAIAISNDTEYGLSGAVFTRCLGKGLALAKQIKSGAVHINSKSVHDEASLPHGGIKNSGWGRFNADAGFDEFLVTKTITFKSEL
jgi:acyl-CoA reductase-like NAD-dependent aldehyde dehydrogenase